MSLVSFVTFFIIYSRLYYEHTLALWHVHLGPFQWLLTALSVAYFVFCL